MKQTLKQAVYLAHKGKDAALYRAASYLSGCPEGGWGETVQAVANIRDELPLRSLRSYSVDQFIAAIYYLDHADRFVQRPFSEAMVEADRISNA
jgi:hypothetical protein